MGNVTNIGQQLRCNICGNGVEVKKVGAGDIICCGQPMENIENNNE